MPKKKSKALKPKKPKYEKSGPRTPLEIKLDKGQQYCPNCNSNEVWVDSIESIEGKRGYLKFIKLCRDCNTYCYIIKKL